MLVLWIGLKGLAIGLAPGASRFRLIRQMMAEGILLSLLGGIGGFVLAYGLAALNSHFTTPSVIPSESDFHLDWTAGVFVFVLAVVCGIGFSLAPALQATRTDVAPALKEGSALQLPGYRHLGLRNLPMVAQVAAKLLSQHAPNGRGSLGLFAPAARCRRDHDRRGIFSPRSANPCSPDASSAIRTSRCSRTLRRPRFCPRF